MANLKPEIDLLRQKLNESTLPDDLRIKATRMIDRLGAIEQTGSKHSFQEFEITSKYIEWISSIPFGQLSQDNLDLKNAKQILDKHHFGLEQVKETILEFMAIKKLHQQRQAENQIQATQNSNTNGNGHINANVNAPINPVDSSGLVNSQGHVQNQNNQPIGGSTVLCFVGVQGIGKTTMAKSIAKALGRSFEKIALGAFASVHEIRGRSKGELAAEPGQIVKAIIKSGSMNPVILLDEIDKVSDSSNLRADIMAALLEILDPEQNYAFKDRYIDYPLNLSQCIFITTANNLKGLSAALLDRLDIIRFSSYSDEEKKVIARDYLLPKVRKMTGIGPDQLDFTEEAWPLLIRPLGFDPGIRQLERNLKALARKVAKMIVEGQRGKVTITPENFREFFPEKIAVYS